MITSLAHVEVNSGGRGKGSHSHSRSRSSTYFELEFEVKGGAARAGPGRAVDDWAHKYSALASADVINKIDVLGMLKCCALGV